MPTLAKSRLPNQFPADESLSPQARHCLDQMLLALNTLIGQGSVPPGTSINAFGSSILNPIGAQMVTGGSRTSSITTPIIAVAQPTLINFYWDGTNTSQRFQVVRDDGSSFGPFITGSPLTVTGLVASTKYFFYFYFDENLQQIQAATVTGVSVGSPPIAFTSKNLLAAQQQFLKNRIPLALLLSTTGVTTPATGSTTVSGGSGGGAAGGGGAGNLL